MVPTAGLPPDPPGRSVASFVAGLGPRDFTLLVIGGIIGDGVYVVAAMGATFLGPAQLVAWLLAGALAAVIALAFVQCSTIHPEVGGSYAYTKRAFGPTVGFVAGWALYAGEWVALPVFPLAFINYLTLLAPALAAPVPSTLAKLALIAVATAINIRGVRATGLVNDVMTVAKLVPLGCFMLLGLVYAAALPTVAAEHLTPFAPLGLGGIGSAVLLIFWAYAGFELSVLPAAEVREPRRTMPRGIVLGVAVTTAVYLLCAFAVVVAVPWAEVATSHHPVADAAAAMFGALGWPPSLAVTIAAAGAVISIAGVYQVFMLAVARLSYALAGEGLFPHAFGLLHARFRTPYVGLLFQAAATFVGAVLFDLTGLIGSAVFFLGLCYILTSLSALRLVSVNPDQALHLPALRPLLALGALSGGYLSLQAPPEVLLGGTATIAAGLLLFLLRGRHWGGRAPAAPEHFERHADLHHRWLWHAVRRVPPNHPHPE